MGSLPGIIGDSTCVRSEKIPPDHLVETTTSLLCAGCFLAREEEDIDMAKRWTRNTGVQRGASHDG